MHRDYYEQPSIWARDLTEDPAFTEKTNLFMTLIPPSVETVLDVGCGNGAITNILGQRWGVTGLDFSGVALKQVKTNAVLGSCRSLPFQDDAFDLVLSSEMIEHLATADMQLALAEMMRVARRYILISVPFEEQLDCRIACCAKCETKYHVYDHQQSFSVERLKGLFPGTRVLSTLSCGGRVSSDWPTWLLRLRQSVLGVYWRHEGRHSPMCPNCGCPLPDAHESPLRLFGRVATRACYELSTCCRPKKPQWLVVLFDLLSDIPPGEAADGE